MSMPSSLQRKKNLLLWKMFCCLRCKCHKKLLYIASPKKLLREICPFESHLISSDICSKKTPACGSLFKQKRLYDFEIETTIMAARSCITSLVFLS